MGKRARYYVRIERSDDGSRTYKGAWVRARCEGEAAAWRESFPTYEVTIVPAPEARADVRRWQRIVNTGRRYYPSMPQQGADA